MITSSLPHARSVLAVVPPLHMLPTICATGNVIINSVQIIYTIIINGTYYTYKYLYTRAAACSTDTDHPGPYSDGDEMAMR